MPYITGRTTAVYPSPTASVIVELPTELEENDLILINCGKDGVGAINTPTGYTRIGLQVTATSGNTWFYKIAGASETDPVITSGNDEGAVTCLSVKDFDVTTPIHVNTNNTWSGAGPHASNALTTTNNNCLIFYSWSIDYTMNLDIGDPSEAVDISKLDATNMSQMVVYGQQHTAGLVDVVNMLPERTNEAGGEIIFAVNNSTGGSLSPAVATGVTFARRFGVRDAPVVIDPTTIITDTVEGVALLSNVPVVGSAVMGTQPWFSASSLVVGGIVNSGEWIGASIATPATDWTDKIFSIVVAYSEVAAARFGEKGCNIVFSDSLGNWAAFNLGRQPSWVRGIARNFNISVADSTPVDSSSPVAIDWTDVTHYTLLTHKVTGNTQVQRIQFKNMMIKSVPILVSGGSDAPITPGFLSPALNGESMYAMAGLQGSLQGVSLSGLQLGDGTTPTYTDFTGGSFETPLPSPEVDIVDFTTPFIVYSSAGDTLTMESCVLKANTSQVLKYHTSSSTSSTDSWSGASIIGWDVTGLLGKTFNKANFTNCNVTQNGSGLDECQLLDSPVISQAPNDITSCSFTSTGNGHAVDLGTIAVTQTIQWSSQTAGYAGTDGNTGNETIVVSVNTGITLTINVASGASTPTIKNDGVGTVNVVAGAVTVQVTSSDANGNIVGSANVMIRASNGTGPFPYRESVTITSSGTVATVSHTGHGMATGDKVDILGVTNGAEYDGVKSITVTDVNTYTYVLGATQTSPATGTITSTFVALQGITNATTGILSTSRTYTTNQPVTGWGRKSTSSPYYKTGNINNTIDSVNGLNAIALLILDE